MLYDLKNRTTRFGQKRSWVGQDKKPRSDTHKGDDYAATYGNDPVPAIQPGTVTVNSYDSVFGWRLHVRRADGVMVRYHMLAERSPLPVGTSVRVSQIVGRTGASAANASGNHVHIQVEVNGKPVDPRPYITTAAPAQSAPAAPLPLPIPIGKPNMFLAWSVNGGGYLFTEKGRADVPNTQVWGLLVRLLNSTPSKPDKFNAAEIDMLRNVINSAK